MHHTVTPPYLAGACLSIGLRLRQSHLATCKWGATCELPVACSHNVMPSVVCCPLQEAAMHHTVTPPLQGLEPQPDCDSARVIRQSASGGPLVSCLWHAVTCHLLCVGPCMRLQCTAL